MKIQRRTFLGGLLAAIAASTLRTGDPIISQAKAAEIEKRINRVMPEPEQGYELLITPGYGMEPFKVSSVCPVLNEQPLHPSFSIHMERPRLFSNEWNGIATPIEVPQYRSFTLHTTVDGPGAVTIANWMSQLTADVFAWNGRKKDWNGRAEFGKIGDKPMIELIGLFPQSYDNRFDTESDKYVVDAVFRFDYYTQNVL